MAPLGQRARLQSDGKKIKIKKKGWNDSSISLFLCSGVKEDCQIH